MKVIGGSNDTIQRLGRGHKQTKCGGKNKGTEGKKCNHTIPLAMHHQGT